MGCTGECTGNCAANFVCTGHQAVCPGNLTGWIPITAGVTTVDAVHLANLESAINSERTDTFRRCAGTSPACVSNCPGSYPFAGARGVGNVIAASHWNAVASAINSTPYNVNGNTEAAGVIIGNVSAGAVILKANIDALRTAVNNVEGYCICDAFTQLVCGCNVNCVLDGVSG